jgi:hypothetical protein
MVLMETDESRILNSIIQVARKAAGDVATSNFSSALGFNCSSHRLVIDDLSKEYELLKSVWGSTPFLVVSSGGEQGPSESGVTWHTNMACVALLFSSMPLLQTSELTADYVEQYVHEGTRVERTMGPTSQIREARADVQGSLIVYNSYVGVGEDISIEIDLVNAGNAPAKLVKIENLVVAPLTLRNVPIGFGLEGSSINMKGMILSPMGTRELKLVATASHKGELQLNPKVLYLDEGGKYRYHVPEPLPIVVRDLGLSGWLKGPARKD